MFSLPEIFKRFWGRITLTLSLVTLESFLDVLYPLFIGWAVNDLLEGSYRGLILLAVLGVVSLTIGASRRFYDTRIYSGIYCKITSELVNTGRRNGQSVSAVNARCSLLHELVEFFEHSVPEIIMSIVGVVGILFVIFSLNTAIFFCCLGLLLLMITVYWLTGARQYAWHAQHNTLMEQQVDVLSHKTRHGVKAHFVNLMRWNIKLSDMETLNFSIIFLGAIALFVATPVLAISYADTAPEAGTILSLLIYAFEFAGKVTVLPFFIQQLIRLQEISHRLNEKGADYQQERAVKQ